MDAQTKEDAIAGIVGHIKGRGDMLDEWYCGITNDIDERLFGFHNVYETKNVDYWIYYECKSKADAQFVEEAFLKSGCKGDTGGGKPDSVFVYAYKMMEYTVE